MTNKTEKETRELTSADLEDVVAGTERCTHADFSIVKTLDKASVADGGSSIIAVL